MSAITVTALGVGDAFSARHANASLLLEADGFTLGIDCPDRYAGVLSAAAERSGHALALENVDHMLITHVHGDHVNGLEGLAFRKHFVEGKRLGLVTSPELREVLWAERLAVAMSTLWDGERMRTMSFCDYFAPTLLDWERAVQVGPFRIEARRTVHHVPTSALRIHAGGRSLGYSADTAFDPELIDWLAACDLVIHETNLGPAHTPYSELARLPSALRERMRLIHYPDGFDTDGSAVRALVEGERFAI